MDIHRSTDRKNRIGYSLLISQWKFQAYVEDGNDILIEDDIVKAVSFNWIIYGTTDVIVDKENLFFNTALNKNKFKIRTRAWETH